MATDCAHEICEAAQRGQTSELSRLLCTTAPVYVWPVGFEAIRLTSANGHTDCVKALLAANVAAWFSSGTISFAVRYPVQHMKVLPPLLLAADNGYPDVVELLIEARSFRGSDYDRAAAWYAARNGHCAVIARLIDLKVDVTKAPSRLMGTPLHAAARYDSLDAAVLLVRAKAVVEAKNRGGYTPLEQAVRWRAHSVAEMLLVRAKADVNAASTGSRPVLDLALQNADYHAVTLLLDAGINVAPPTLHFPGVAALFASMPAHQTGSSVVLHEALQRGDRAVAEFLVVHAKVDVNATHPSLKRRPIDTTLKKHDFSMAQLLLDAKAVLPHGRRANHASTCEPRSDALP